MTSASRFLAAAWAFLRPAKQVTCGAFVAISIWPDLVRRSPISMPATVNAVASRVARGRLA